MDRKFTNKKDRYNYMVIFNQLIFIIFFVKLVFLINNNFFNLNFELFNYFSIFLILIIILIFLKNEKIDNKIYLSLFVVLIFSGKQFANFSQASNIAWTICFLYYIF